ncbi:MAG: type II toxin-antitoxin system HicB family antitoxin [Thermomicrobiales bacterium]
MVEHAAHHAQETDGERAIARQYQVEITWSPEDAAFTARVPETPGVITHGATREEAAAQAEDAIITWLTAHHDAGIPVSLPTHTRRNTPGGAWRPLERPAIGQTDR